MYLSSSSSSSQKSMASASASGGGLTRYGSAPGSLLTTAVDSVILNPNAATATASTTVTREFSVALGSSPTHHPPRPPPPPFLHYFSGDSSSVSSESTCKANSSSNNNNNNTPGGAHGHDQQQHHHLLHLSKETGNKGFDVGGGSGSGSGSESGSGLHRSFGFSEMGVGVGGSSSSAANLVRQRSSPAGFLGHLSGENAFSLTRGIGSSNGGHGVARLKSQLSFTRQDSLSQISEINEGVVGGGVSTDNGHHGTTHSYATTSFGIEPWENTSSILFSAPPGKRAKSMEGDIYFGPSDSQFGFPHDIVSVEKLLHIPEDSVPCKIRAKRGCATHPRSIAERERRTRISGRLKKLQELVPNMDKQTSYADMLDLAVQHIKSLQNQVQKLRSDLDNCTCGCKRST